MREATIKALEKTAVKIPNLSNTIRNMSGGQRQCVAIARTATFASKLIVMDEPTAALGVQETAQVENIIRTLKQQGESLILISHNMRQVFDLVDRIVVFRRGRIVADLPQGGDRRPGYRRLHHRREDPAAVSGRGVSREGEMTVRFGLLGAGRIGKVHARAITGNPDARLVAVADAMAPAAEALAGQYGAEVRDDRGDRGGRRRGRRGDLHADRHPCRPDRALRARRQGDLLREADRPRRRPGAGMPEGGGGDRRAADGRLQPPLRPALPRGAQGDRRRQRRQGGDGQHHLARSRARRRSTTSGARAASSAT